MIAKKDYFSTGRMDEIITLPLKGDEVIRLQMIVISEWVFKIAIKRLFTSGLT